jgi:ABC-type branched-subunit amino acid transport system substrate-binding protein
LGSRLFDLPEGFGHRIFVASPVAPEDRAASAMHEVHALLESNGLSRAFLPAQILGYSAAKLLVEGLKRAGRDLTREKVVNELERLYRFQTGATPPLTYGPNRRIGSHGAYFLAVDLQRRDLVPAGKWIELD